VSPRESDGIHKGWQGFAIPYRLSYRQYVFLRQLAGHQRDHREQAQQDWHGADNRPRVPPPTHGQNLGRVNGLLLVLSGVLLIAPWPLSFLNTLPAYGALLAAAGSLERDGYGVVAGYIMRLLTLSDITVVAVLGKIRVRAILSDLDSGAT
jgi:hypothetical protein